MKKILFASALLVLAFGTGAHFLLENDHWIYAGVLQGFALIACVEFCATFEEFRKEKRK